MSQTALQAGDVLTVAATFATSGTVTDLYFAFYYDTGGYAVAITARNDITSLGNNRYSATATVNADTYAGHYTLGAIWFCTDTSDCQVEEDPVALTTGDGSIAGVTVFSDLSPALQVDSFDAPSYVEPGQAVPLTVTFSNQGTQTAHNYVVQIFADPSNGAEGGVVSWVAGTWGPNLAPGESATFSGVWTATDGVHPIYAHVDAWHFAPDSNRSNNWVLANVQAGGPHPQPDLHPISLTVVQPLDEGSQIHGTAVLANTGNASSGSFTASLFIDGLHAASQTYTLGENESATWNFQLPNNLLPGPHVLALRLDVANATYESNETNNELSRAFDVSIITDLAVVITGIDHEDLDTEIGSLPHPAPRHTIHLSVTNHGSRPALAILETTATATLRFLGADSSRQIDERNLTLAAGESVSLEIVWDPSGEAFGDFQIQSTVTPVGQLEIAPGDNSDSANDFVIVGGFGGILP